MQTQEAQAMADQAGLDLVEVSPTARPPVCRIMDFGKFKYEQSKKERASKKKQHSTQIKEVKFRPKTEEHDYQFKMRHGEEFLEKHHKLKVTMMFRGREMDHRERGAELLRRLVEDLKHVGTVEHQPRFEGRLMVMYMSPLPSHQQRPRKKAEEEEKEKEGSHAKAEDESGGGEAVS